MNLQANPLLSSSSDPAAQIAQLQTLLRQVSQQVNSLSSGKISAVPNASTSPPADGTGNPGDFVARQGATTQGPAGAQYVFSGWRCVGTGSTPATRWMEVIESVRLPPAAPAPTPAPTSAPTPSAPAPYSQKIQAENATLHGITAVTTIAGYEGTGHADWFRSGYDEYLEFSFTGVPTGGASGNLTLRFANYGDQTMTVLLNGATTGTMYTFANSGAAWTTKVISGVSLNGGTATVRLTPEYSGYTYIDYAQFDQLTGAPPPPPAPAPAPTPPSPPPPAPAPAPGSPPYYPFGSRIDLSKATITTPVAPTATPSTAGGSLAAATYYFKIVAIDAAGNNTAPSPESSATTTGTTGSVALSWTAVTSAASYQIFFATTSGGQVSYFTSATNSFTFTTTSGANIGTPAGQYPFGIKVSGQTHAQMDAAVTACYDKWKLARLAKSPTFTPTAGIFTGQQITTGYHVQWGTADEATRSEGMGYGMLITVLMAGYDANAKTYFDGMYQVVRGCPAIGMTNQLGTGVTNYLMDYRILPNITSGDGWPALDGDMDITLALLMAHRQWGSAGAINYYQQALNSIAAMKAAHFTNEVIVARNVSRVSDYMAGHFRSFKKASGDVFWDNVRTKALTLAQNITTGYSPTAKLQPGFIYDPFGNPRPDTVVHLDRSGIEQLCDANSVRNEWRWATDFVFSNDAGWGNLADGIVAWLKSSSGGSASGFSYAYNLDGSALSGLYHEGTTSGCVMAGCMVNTAHQTFLNTLFAGNTGTGYKTAYYEAELLLLPLILVSGNWWLP